MWTRKEYHHVDKGVASLWKGLVNKRRGSEGSEEDGTVRATGMGRFHVDCLLQCA